MLVTIWQIVTTWIFDEALGKAFSWISHHKCTLAICHWASLSYFNGRTFTLEPTQFSTKWFRNILCNKSLEYIYKVIINSFVTMCFSYDADFVHWCIYDMWTSLLWRCCNARSLILSIHKYHYEIKICFFYHILRFYAWSKKASYGKHKSKPVSVDYWQNLCTLFTITLKKFRCKAYKWVLDELLSHFLTCV